MRKALVIVLMLWAAPSWAYSPMALKYFGGASPEYGGYWLVMTDCENSVHNVYYGSCAAVPHVSGSCVYYTIDIYYHVDEFYNYLPRYIMGDWVSNDAYKAAVDYALSKGWIDEEDIIDYQALIDGRSWDMGGILYIYYDSVMVDGMLRRYGVIRLHKQANTFDGACYHGDEYYAFFYWWADGIAPVPPNRWIKNLPQPLIDNEYIRRHGWHFDIYGLFLEFIKGLSDSSLFTQLPSMKKDDLDELGAGVSVINVNLGNLGGQHSIDLSDWGALWLILKSIFLTCCMYYAVMIFINRVEE